MRRAIIVLSVFVLCILVFIFSCKDNHVDIDNDVEITDDTEITVNNNSENLKSRLTVVNEYINPVILSKSSMQKSQSVKGADEENHYWEYVFNLHILKHNGNTLSATHIEIVDKIAYVSYNVQGEVHAGALEVLDLTIPGAPVVLSTAFFDNVDINSLAVDPNISGLTRKVWLAGSRNKDGAIAIEVNVLNGVVLENAKTVSLKDVFDNGIAASANSICYASGSIYITAGQTNGGLVRLDASNLAYQHSKSFSSAKYVVSNGKKDNASQIIVLTTGDSSSLRIYKNDLASAPTVYNIGVIKHQEVEEPYKGKSTLAMSLDNNYVYVSMASSGFRVFDVNSGAEKFHSTPSMLTNGNTNSVFVSNDYIYMANGADGLAVALAPTVSSNQEIVPKFVWDLLDKPSSANFVAGDDEYIFVAKGLGGVKVLRKTNVGNNSIGEPGDPVQEVDDNGVPGNLAPDVVLCNTLLNTIYSKVLPNGVNALVKHPEYFENTLKNIVLTKPATEVTITFLDEGAGYRNVLGYYYYNKNNPPQSIDDLNKKIIFPNSSKVGSGGGLIAGKTMKLLGVFDENTVIGFYLIANGWNSVNKVVTDGYGSLYSNPEFNKNNNIQTVTFYDKACGIVAIGFEDTLLPGGDKDYNDAIFQVSVSPADALVTTEYIQID